MKPWTEQSHFAGLDWAKDHHQLVIVDRQGQTAEQFVIDHTQEGWAKAAERLKHYPGLAVSVETNHGLAVDQLLDAGAVVFPVNPQSAHHYRQRKAPTGIKDDHLDAWSLADALRVDGHGWKPIQPANPLVQKLRLLCRDEVALIEVRTALINQLQAALLRYYPAALEAFDDWTMPAAWAFITAFPTPEQLAQAGRTKWLKFLHLHKLYRPQTVERRLALFARAAAFQGRPEVVAASQQLAVSLAALLRTLHAQLKTYRHQIRDVFAQHPDQALFASLPGLGDKLAPRVLAEVGDDRARFAEPQALQCYAGSAPVTFASGQMRKVHIRRACNTSLRSAIHLWANLSRAKCAWAQAYYQAHRDRGQSHACALRCLAQRWLAILWRMWQDHTLYDPELHLRNQLQHGSWVLKLIEKTT